MEQDFHLCPKLEAMFGLLGKRWTGLIISVLLDGPKRFKDISAVIPNISDKMLAERFKELEAEDIVIRRVYNKIPVMIVYELTDKGKSLEPMMNECQKWADDWMN
jgi:DNA-binding HxlR family transcriptional regulator